MARNSGVYGQAIKIPPKQILVISIVYLRGIISYRRIHVLISREGTVISEKVMRRIMTEDGLVVRGKSRRKYNSYQGEISPSVPNAVNRDFHAEKPNEKWLTDITEFAIPAGKVYLSPIVDCFDGMLP